MESFGNLYDIESPINSERKMEVIENSIHNSLLYNNESLKSYNMYNSLLKALLYIILMGIVSIVIVVILIVMTKL